MPSQAMLFAALAATAMAMPHEVIHAKHLMERATTINKDFGRTADVSEYCFAVDSANNDWYYAMAGGAWGSASGTFGSTNGQICVPTNNNAGGAMYIGPFANPGPGSTKFECFFPTSGTANCDISLVDGYSLSMTCGAGGSGGPIFGGGGDFFSQGNPCPDAQGGNCINQNGYAPSQSDVAAFFQYGVQGNNKYCIWDDCSQDYYFPVTSSMGCYITGF